MGVFELVAKLLTILAEVGLETYRHATGEDVQAELIALGQSLEASILKLSGGKLADLLDAADDASLAARLAPSEVQPALVSVPGVARALRLPGGLPADRVTRLLGYEGAKLLDRDAGELADVTEAGGSYELLAA